MLRSLIFQRNFNLSIKLYRTYLSQDFKNVMQQNVPLENVDRNIIDELHVNKRTSAIRADYMARNMANNEESRVDMAEELLKLRNQSDATDIIQSTSHAVIKNYSLAGAYPELLDILKNRLKYGIFIDKFSGSFLMDTLLEEKRFLEALQVSVENYLQDDWDSQLVCALSLKAAYEALKANLLSTIKLPIVEEVKEVIKVRVKYIRNPDPDDKSDDLKHMIGLALLEMSTNAPEDIKQNFTLVGYILTSQFDQAQQALNSQKIFDKEVINGALDLVKANQETMPPELADSLEVLSKSSTSFLEEKLNSFLKEAIDKEEKSLIAQQKENYTIWSKQFKDYLQAAINHRDKLMRLENVEQILEEIKTKKKKLWYFEMEDQVDMEIFKKFKFYPKKWFGKKKKPRLVDENYVPPDLRR